MRRDDVWLFGTVVSSEDGTASIDINGTTFTDIKVSRGDTLTAGHTAVLLQSGRRMVCVGSVAP